MTLLNTTLIAFALAMDAFAVSIAVGLKLRKISGRQIFRLSWHFGLFQGLMPLAGWMAGAAILQYVKEFGHWVAFGLLFLVGSNMIRESFHGEEDQQSPIDPTKGKSLVILSVATSIDALAVGFSLSMLNVSVVIPALIIGIVAGSMTIIGMYLGRTLSTMKPIRKVAEIIGGLVLWGIGVNILFQHSVF